MALFSPGGRQQSQSRRNTAQNPNGNFGGGNFAGQNQRQFAPQQNRRQMNPAFGQRQANPVFGQPQTNSMFGQSQANPVFGQPQTNSMFGQLQANPVFGQPQTNSMFGQSQANPAFGQPQMNSPFAQKQPQSTNSAAPVRYEQLTEAEMALLNKGELIKESASSGQEGEFGNELKVPPPETGTEIFFNMSQDFLNKLSDAIQNGDNGSKYYTLLADKISGRAKEIVSEIGRQSGELSKELSEIYKNLTRGEPKTKEVEIASFDDFHQALAYAANEEIRNLSELCDIYEGMMDERQLKKLNSVIYRKILDINRINSLIRFM